MSGQTTLRSTVHPGLSALATILLVTVGLPASSRGAENYALSFDGNDDLVTFGIVPTLPDTFTFEVWIKPTDTSTFGIVVGHVAGPTQACSLGAFVSVGAVGSSVVPRFTVDPAGCGNGEVVIALVDIKDIWVHVAGTYDGDAEKIYLNGQLEDERSGIPFNASNYMTAGAVVFFNGPQSFYSGEIDEIRVWDVVRSQAEIQDNIFTQLTGDEPGLVGYWPMNEGTGQFLDDLTLPSTTGVLGTNSNVEPSDPTWVISGVPGSIIFADGFESADTSAWSATVP